MNPQPQRALTGNFRRHRPVTCKMAVAIARELAIISGHSAQDASSCRGQREQMLQAQQSRRAAVMADSSPF